MNKWCEKEINEMLVRVSKLKSKEEVKNLFDAILTPREINDMARRLKALEMLEKGYTYADIHNKLGLNSASISRISNMVGFGFRRGQSTIEKKNTGNTKKKSKGISYKGAKPIHGILSDK